MAPTIYNYDPTTLLFTGASTPMECPLEAGNWLLPAFCTQMAPPAVPEGHAARFDPEANDWAVVQLAPAEGETLPFPRTAVERGLKVLAKGVQAHLDGQAQALGYDDILTAISYAEEDAVPAYQDEARALRAWRSRVWNAFHGLTAGLDQAESEIELPMLEDLIPQLPAYVAPGAEEA